MGFFDWFRRGRRKRRAKEPQVEEPRDPLAEYSGMRVEVFSADREPLFEARLAVSSVGSVELQRIPGGAEPEEQETEDAAKTEETEEAEKPVHVFLRGYEANQQKAVHMEGDMLPLPGGSFRAEGLRIVGKDNDRAFYRQDVGSNGEAAPIGRMGAAETKRCKVVNISAGGACIRTDAQYQMGDRLLLRSELPPDNQLALRCTVCRIARRRGGMTEYGCKFENLDSNAEDQIAKAIMQLQLLKRRR